jgi:histidine triad (HIT) family protein
MNDCVFCKIVTGEIPSQKIYENEHCVAFLDIHPINRGHALVIPKGHHANIYETPQETFAEVMRTVQFLAPKVKEAVGAQGINIGINNDAAAGQLVYHLHVHIIPRWSDDGHMSWHGNPYQDGEIATIKDIIIQEFK